MASQEKQTVVTGPLCLIKVNGITLGRVQSISPRVSFGTEGVYELGSIMPQEHVQNRYEGSLTIERYLLRRDKLKLIGLGEDILEKDIIDIEVIDKVTNQTLRVYRGVTFSDYSNNFNTNAITGDSATAYYLSCDQGE